MTLNIIIKLGAPLAILAGVITSAWMIRKQMRANYILTIRNKSLEYSLYSNEHLRDARIEVERVFGPLFTIKEAIPMSEIEKQTGEHQHLHASILTLLAHWESMALSIDSGVASDDVCFEMVASTLIQHVKIFRNFIETRREKNPRIYDHLMNLRRRWEDKIIRIERSQFQPILAGTHIRDTVSTRPR